MLTRAEPWARNVPEKDSFVAQRLREAGAILLGKTSVGALAYGDVWLGEKTKNPWNLDSLLTLISSANFELPCKIALQ